MTREEATEFIAQSVKSDVDMSKVAAAIKALEQEPTADNDSAVDCIVDVLGSYTDLDIPYKREIAENILTNLPSVTSQPRKGHWIPVFQGDEIIDYRCSCCEFGNTFGKGTVGMNYCPRCGSRNEVEE